MCLISIDECFEFINGVAGVFGILILVVTQIGCVIACGGSILRKTNAHKLIGCPEQVGVVAYFDVASFRFRFNLLKGCFVDFCDAEFAFDLVKRALFLLVPTDGGVVSVSECKVFAVYLQ